MVYTKTKKRVWRPGFHFTAQNGWLNDPNGLIYHNGLYHLFYQHNPNSCEWESMHWGHAVSTDILCWEHLPIALYPDKFYDNHAKGGCFSGSAVKTDDGLLALIYTGCVPGADYEQTQNIAFSRDGINFEKYEGNPIIETTPDGVGSKDFRDPKVFKHEGKWYMVVGTCTGEPHDGGDGRVLLYSSPDLLNWSFVSVLFESNGRYGSMFECPDLFYLNGKWVLLVSPMYAQNGRKCCWFVGDVDFSTGKFTPETNGVIDYGFDYFAPQTFLDENGNRISIGWMNSWPWKPWFTGFGPTADEGWRGAMSIPRKLWIGSDNCLRSLPIDNLKDKRIENQSYDDVCITVEPLLIETGSTMQYEIDVSANTRDVPSGVVLFSVTSQNEVVCTIELALNENLLRFSRKVSGSFTDESCYCPLKLENGEIDLRVIVDRSTIEILTDNGLSCLSANVYSENYLDGIAVYTPFKSATLRSINVYEIAIN